MSPLIELAGPPGRVPTPAHQVREKLASSWTFADAKAKAAFDAWERHGADDEPPRDETGS